MHKSLRSILTENDQEFTYWVKSIYDIHDSDTMDQIRLAMLPYDLRDIEKGPYKPIGEGDKDFPNVSAVPSYAVKVVLGLEPPNSDDALQKVAMFTRIDANNLLVHKDGEDPHKEEGEVETSGEYKNLATTARDFSSSLDTVYDDAQDEVGEKRVGSFLKDLEAQLKKEREAIKQVEPKLKEAFVTSHFALNELKSGWRKGFYVVERSMSDSGTMNVYGPFKSQPTNYEFVPELNVPGAGVLTVESKDKIVMEAYDRNFKYTLKPVSKTQLKETKYSVNVQDQDTGRTYNVVVDAVDDSSARDRAVVTVARQNKLNQDSLIAMEPKLS